MNSEDLGAYNDPYDMKHVGDGWYDEKVFVNHERSGESVETWVGRILHELLHGSVKVNTAASFLADKFFEDAGEPCNNKKENPLGLSASQKRRARGIIEEIIVRRVVEVYSEYYPDFVTTYPRDDVVDRYNNPDKGLSR